MTILLARDFETRENLESVIRSEMGDDTARNREAGHSIAGTREELKVLRLDDRTHIFGVKCVISDQPTKNIAIKKR